MSAAKVGVLHFLCDVAKQDYLELGAPNPAAVPLPTSHDWVFK
jgi:hypothetical protein